MSLIVSVYVNEGIVMASDSRLTLNVQKPISGPIIETNSIPFSDSTFKTFSCPNCSGISTCGNASYNNKPIAGFIEHFITTITKSTPVSAMPQMLINYFNGLNNTVVTIFQVCGYESINGKLKQKVFRVFTGASPHIEEQSTENNQGAMWDGETIILSKIIKGQILAPQIIDANNINLAKPDGTTQIITQAVIIDKSNIIMIPEAQINWQYMSLQDAVDFAKFAIETTISAMRFQSINKTVGGPVDILVIKPMGTKWLKHKNLR